MARYQALIDDCGRTWFVSDYHGEPGAMTRNTIAEYLTQEEAEELTTMLNKYSVRLRLTDEEVEEVNTVLNKYADRIR